MFKIENKKMDSKPQVQTTTLKQGKQGMFRIAHIDSASQAKESKIQLQDKTPLKKENSSTPKDIPNNNLETNVNGVSEKSFTINANKSPSKNSIKENERKKTDNVKDNEWKTPQHIISTSPFRDNMSVISMDDNAPQLLLTWIGRKVNVRNVKKSLKELIAVTEPLMPPGHFYTCCENFDTYLNGGLYPALHMTSEKRVISRLLSSGDFIDSGVLGENNMVEQAVYTEVASVTPPGGTTPPTSSVISVAAFRSFEETVPEVLIKEWKTWTGTRGFMVDVLQAGLTCCSVKFYVKKEPKDEPSSFFYLVTTEVAMEEPSNEGLFIDVLQRFRVERFLGFRSIYKKVE